MTHQDKLLVDWKGLKAMGVPYCRAHVIRLVEAGTFPQPIKFGKHRSARIAWLYNDILNWVEHYSRLRKKADAF